MTRDKFKEKIESAARLLKLRPYTAIALANHMHVSRAAAYRRINRLPEYGYTLRTKIVRQGERGPESVAYYIE